MADTVTPEIRTELAGLGQEKQQAQAQLVGLGQADEARNAAHEAALRPQEDALTAETARPLPPRQHAQMPAQPGKPPVDPKEYEGLSYALIGMALVGGAVSHGNWMGASASLNGALKGMLEGDQQKAKAEYDKYDRAFKSAVEMEKQFDSEYQDALANRKISINEMLQRINITARRQGAEDIAAATKTKNLQTVISQIEARRTQLMGTEQRAQSVQIRVDASLARGGGGGSGAGSGGTLSPKYQSDENYRKSVDDWAKRLNMGIPLPARFAQMVGKQFSSDVFTAASGSGAGEALAGKVNVAEMMSEARKLGTQSASVGIANKELEKFVPLAEKASAAVPRSAWRPLNSLLQAGENTLSPAQKQFVIANRSVINAYAQLIQRGAPTVHSLTEAKDLLLTADGPEVYKAGLRQLMSEGTAASQGLVEAHDDLMKRAKADGGPGAPAPGAAASSMPQPPAGSTATNDRGWRRAYDPSSGEWAYVSPDGAQSVSVTKDSKRQKLIEQRGAPP